MKFENLLSYNSAAANEWLRAEVETTVDGLLDLLLEGAKVSLAGQYPAVEESLRKALTALGEKGVFEGGISSDYWESWVAEWGSGSLMDTSNPAIYSYMASPFWNPERTSLAITGRPEGAYTGLDGEVHDKHTGATAGENLEDLSQNDPSFQAWMQKVGLPSDAFQPKAPLHFMRETILTYKKFIIEQFNDIIVRFPASRFFE